MKMGQRAGRRQRIPHARRAVPLGGVGRYLSSATLVAVAYGCWGESEPEVPREDHRVKMDVTITHEACATAEGTAQDLDGDGRPDIYVVYTSGKRGRELCRQLDLNFDGRADLWLYKDAQGKVRRREADFDRDGRVDEISLLRGGVLREKHQATGLGGKLDTWHTYKEGRITLSRRDSDGDTFIDQWWEYPDSAKPECPKVHSDVNGDGRPDPGATVDVCAQREEEDALVEESAFAAKESIVPTETSQGAKPIGTQPVGSAAAAPSAAASGARPAAGKGK